MTQRLNAILLEVKHHQTTNPMFKILKFIKDIYEIIRYGVVGEVEPKITQEDIDNQLFKS